MSDLNNIVEKIRKLVALSESSNQNEAEAAWVQAQRLQAKYNLDQSVLAGKPKEPLVVKLEVCPQIPTEVFGRILYVLREYFFIYNYRTLRQDNKLQGVLVGTAENIAVAQEVYLALLGLYLRAMKLLAKGLGTKRVPKGYAQPWGIGMCEGFMMKLRLERDNQKQEWGLVPVTDPKLKEWAKDKFNLTSTPARAVEQSAAEMAISQLGMSAGFSLKVRQELK